MKLEFIPLDKLAVSKANMRYGKKAPDVSDILPTVRARGIIQSLVVRPAAQPGHYEILAGARRYHAALIVSAEASSGAEGVGEETGDTMLLPCAILDAGDDAAAVEASLIENLARLDPDEVNQWVNFVRLVKEGRGIADIAATFGLPELTVRRVLALGNLMPRIRNLYGAQEIDRVTVRHLTLASKSQQRDWLALHDDPDARAPTGHQLKAWLLGGQSIATRHALFDLASFEDAIVSDLFGEDSYFASPELFWTAQQKEVDARKAAYLDAGWREVVIVPTTQYFHAWEHEKVAKRKGGRVYIELRASGEVCFHEGYMSRKEAARIDRADAVGTRPVRSEITARMQTYVDLHRHAAVRAALTSRPQIALRLMVAHAICGSALWRVTPDPRTARDDLVAESVENAVGEADFDCMRRRVLDLLGFSSEEPHVTGGNARDQGVAGLFLRLLALPDGAMLDIIAIVMGETLASGSAALEAVGNHIGVDMADYWEADDAFFEQLRDRDILTALVAEVVDPQTAAANAGAKGKILKEIIRDGLNGTNGREKKDRWVPRWMAFPPSAYGERGGVGSLEAWRRVEAAKQMLENATPAAAEPGRLAA
ncbi:ParB/RepB/Spo0J family partition protein [Sphingobium yanoikuyae]|uniref:Chromosome partitioning protein ParB n=1 Tax=Sphingobium yanoikuyae TaxID=13690 RepID=A0A085K4D1_SPHYA|nr:ParB N-terminal domain-containing protein [Sphingobium yanoikuyae]AYO78959.1 chromosome partitioning protein ParB [Sphingobium yanoikuyae]KFD27577.1 chromosome partitioning protein ParB [Sphingobium yanoikuyae]MDV3480770.1 ParB N-terminal domain-containing protein [Sphingobium yanoikuyae]